MRGLLSVLVAVLALGHAQHSRGAPDSLDLARMAESAASSSIVDASLKTNGPDTGKLASVRDKAATLSVKEADASARATNDVKASEDGALKSASVAKAGAIAAAVQVRDVALASHTLSEATKKVEAERPSPGAEAIAKKKMDQEAKIAAALTPQSGSPVAEVMDLLGKMAKALHEQKATEDAEFAIDSKACTSSKASKQTELKGLQMQLAQVSPGDRFTDAIGNLTSSIGELRDATKEQEKKLITMDAQYENKKAEVERKIDTLEGHLKQHQKASDILKTIKAKLFKSKIIAQAVKSEAEQKDVVNAVVRESTIRSAATKVEQDRVQTVAAVLPEGKHVAADAAVAGEKAKVVARTAGVSEDKIEQAGKAARDKTVAQVSGKAKSKAIETAKKLGADDAMAQQAGDEAASAIKDVAAAPATLQSAATDTHGCSVNAGYTWCATADQGKGRCLLAESEVCPSKGENKAAVQSKKAEVKASNQAKNSQKSTENYKSATAAAGVVLDSALTENDVSRTKSIRAVQAATAKAYKPRLPRFREVAPVSSSMNNFATHMMDMLKADQFSTMSFLEEIRSAPAAATTMAGIEALAAAESAVPQSKTAADAAVVATGFNGEHHVKLFELLTKLEESVANTINVRTQEKKDLTAAWEVEEQKYEDAKTTGSTDVSLTSKETKRLEGLVEQQRVRQEEDSTLSKTATAAKGAVQAELEAILDSCEKASVAHRKQGAALSDEISAIQDVSVYVKEALAALGKTLRAAVERANEKDDEQAVQERQIQIQKEKELIAAKEEAKLEKVELAREVKVKVELQKENDAAMSAAMQSKKESMEEERQAGLRLAKEKREEEETKEDARKEKAAHAALEEKKEAEKTKIIEEDRKLLAKTRKVSKQEVQVSQLASAEREARLKQEIEEAAMTTTNAVTKQKEAARADTANEITKHEQEVAKIQQESAQDKKKIFEQATNVALNAQKQADEWKTKFDEMEARLHRAEAKAEDDKKVLEAEGKRKGEEGVKREALKLKELREEEVKKDVSLKTAESDWKRMKQTELQAAIAKRDAALAAEKDKAKREAARMDKLRVQLLDQAGQAKRAALLRADTEAANAKAKVAQERLAATRTLALTTKQVKEQDLKQLEQQAAEQRKEADAMAKRETSDKLELQLLQKEKERIMREEVKEKAARAAADGAASRAKRETEEAKKSVLNAAKEALLSKKAEKTQEDQMKAQLKQSQVLSATEMLRIQKMNEVERTKLEGAVHDTTARMEGALKDEALLRTRLQKEIEVQKTKTNTELDGKEEDATRKTREQAIALANAQAQAKRLKTTAKLASQKLERVKIEQEMAAAASKDTVKEPPQVTSANKIAVLAATNLSGLKCVQKVNGIAMELFKCQETHAQGFCTQCQTYKTTLDAAIESCKTDAQFHPASMQSVQSKWSKACSCSRDTCDKPALVCAPQQYEITHKAKQTADDCCDTFVCKGVTAKGVSKQAVRETPVGGDDMMESIKDYQKCLKEGKDSSVCDKMLNAKLDSGDKGSAAPPPANGQAAADALKRQHEEKLAMASETKAKCVESLTAAGFTDTSICTKHFEAKVASSGSQLADAAAAVGEVGGDAALKAGKAVGAAPKLRRRRIL